MQLNIHSRSLGRKRILGAGKVLQNTLKGLAQIGIEVCFNEPISKHDYTWIHDLPEAIIEAGFANRPVLVGPNTATTPRDLPRFRRHLHRDSIYLFPSAWAKAAWEAMGFAECRRHVWAAGVDLEQFPSRKRVRSDPEHILIYFKNRDERLLLEVESLVRARGSSYEVFRYGFYQESEYQAALKRAQCAVWIGGTESQGFALMEALATGLPLLVLDAVSLSDNVLDQNDPLVPNFPAAFVQSGATTAPYFDARCGMKIDAIELSTETLDRFLGNIERYDPASFLYEGFSLDSAAKKLVTLAMMLTNQQSSKSFSYSALAKPLRYLDLAMRPWAWTLAVHRLLRRTK